MRIGVGHPGVKEMVPHHVLRDFAKADRAWLEPLIDAIADNAPLLGEGKDNTFANRIHETQGGEEKKGKGKPDKAATKDETGVPKPAAKAAAPAKGGKHATVAASEGPLARGLKKLLGG